MARSTHPIRRLHASLALALAAAAIALPAAQAGTASSIVTEHSASQNQLDRQGNYGPPDPWQYRFLQTQADPPLANHPAYRLVTEHAASQNRLERQQLPYGAPDQWERHFRHEDNTFRVAAEAARSIPSSSAESFDWVAMAIGAGSALGLTLLAAAAVLAVRRTRRRVVPAA